MANHLLLILAVVLGDLMMVVVYHQLKTYDLKANLDQP
jgi:predicted nucleotide-binding protein (sugar kinase/HSP70/actin superfamily)